MSRKNGEKSFATRSEMASQIRSLRTEQGLEQADLAKLVGVSRQTISNIERGTVSPRESTLKRILEALGVAEAEVEFDEQTDRWLIIIGTMIESLPKSHRGIAFEAVVDELARQQRNVSGKRDDYGLAAKDDEDWQAKQEQHFE